MGAKCRCSEIVLGDPNRRYVHGMAFTRNDPDRENGSATHVVVAIPHFLSAMTCLINANRARSVRSARTDLCGVVSIGLLPPRRRPQIWRQGREPRERPDNASSLISRNLGFDRAARMASGVNDRRFVVCYRTRSWCRAARASGGRRPTQGFAALRNDSPAPVYCVVADTSLDGGELSRPVSIATTS
jgi:hypothetical protein